MALRRLCAWLGVFAEQEDAAAATEYAVLLAVILIGCLVAAQAFSQSLEGFWPHSPRPR
jgi:Flp pilus assembly pilin Flp